MDPSLAPAAPRSRRPRELWVLGVVVFLLVLNPALLATRARDVGSPAAPAGEGPVLTVIDEVIGGMQQTTIVVVAVLALVAFRRLVPVLWSFFVSSAPGMLIAVELAVVFWLVYGGLAGIGMPGLFWNPNAWNMLRTSLGVTLFVYWMLYLIFVCDFEAHREEPARQLWHRLRPALESSGFPALLRRSIGDVGAVTAMRWFLAYAGLPALLALTVPAVLPAARPEEARTVVAWPWLAGMVLGVGLSAVIVTTRPASRLHELFTQLARRRLNLRRLAELDSNRPDPNINTWNILIIVTVVVAFSHLDQYVGAKAAFSPLPPPFSICVLLGVLATIAAFLSTRTWFTRIVSVASVLALVAAGGLLDYDVEVRDLHSNYPSAFAQLLRRVSPNTAAPRSYARVVDLEEFQRSIPPRAAEDAWQARQAQLDRWARSFGNPAGARSPVKPILVVVTTSGGALRAAIWTTTVLGTLDQTFDNFHHHVRLITGASGGMLGGARYVCAHARGKEVPGAPGRELPSRDYLTPIAWQIAFRDVFPNSLFPWASYNRGDVLEDAWIASDDGIARTFSDIKAQDDAGLIPSIVFSPMLVEDGRRLLISNLPLHDLTVNRGNVLLEEDFALLRRRFRALHPEVPDRDEPDRFDLDYPELVSVSAIEFFRLFGEAGRARLRLASAVLMSATFPYVTSSAALPTDPPRHVVDAGYYDNYGVNLAASWILSHRVWISAHTSGVLLVQVRAFRNERRLKVLSEEILARRSEQAGRAAEAFSPGPFVRFLPGLVSLVADGLRSVVLPVEGIAKARDSSMYFRNDEQLLSLHRRFTELTGDDQFFRSVIFTCDTYQRGQKSQNVETLNWYIDPEEFAEVRRGMEPYPDGRGTTTLDGVVSRNYLRARSLRNWWSSRGGKLRAGLKVDDEP